MHFLPNWDEEHFALCNKYYFPDYLHVNDIDYNYLMYKYEYNETSINMD